MTDPRRRALLRLAHQFRETDVDAFAAGLSAAQIEEWLEFFLFEPAGGLADWQRTAATLAGLYNANPFRKAGSKPVDPRRFVPRPPPTPREAARSRDQQARLARMQLAALVAGGGGGVIKADGTPGTVSDLFE